jgi:hypothetical protein
MIWKKRCKDGHNLGENSVEALGVVVGDSIHSASSLYVEEADLDIARTFVHPNLVAVMALQDRGVEKDMFKELQKTNIYHSSESCHWQVLLQVVRSDL